MPAMPTAATRLDDGSYNFRIDAIRTIPARVTNGIEFGPQEEMTLTVLDEDLRPTDEITRAWISHSSRKAIDKLIAAGLCKVEYNENDEPIEWEIIPTRKFVGTVVDGKIKGFRKLAAAARRETEEE